MTLISLWIIPYFGVCRWGQWVQEVTAEVQRLHNIFLKEKWVKNTLRGKTDWPLSRCAGQRRRGVGFSMALQAENNTIFESATHCCCCKIEQYRSLPPRLLCWFPDWQMQRTLSAQLSCNRPLMAFMCNEKLLGHILKYARHLLLNYKLFIFISAPGDLRALSWRLAAVKRGWPVLPWNEYEKQLGLSSLALWHVLLRENRWPRRRNVCWNLNVILELKGFVIT